MIRLALLALLALPLAAQITVVGESSGGGASSVDDLTDTTITSATTDDVLKYNGSAWVNTNLLTAVGEDLTTDRVPYVSSGVIASSSNLQFDGFTLKGASGPLFKMNSAGTAGLPSISFSSSQNSGLFLESTNVWGFAAGGNKILTLGGSQTALFQDPSNTSVIVKLGTTPTANPFEIQPESSTTPLAKITPAGIGDFSALRIGGAATSGYVAKGNGTDLVLAQLDYADIAGTPSQYDVFGSYYTTGASPAYFAAQLLGGAAGTAYRITCQTETGTVDMTVSYTTTPGSAGTTVDAINDCGTTITENLIGDMSGTTSVPADNYVRIVFSDEQSGFDIVHWTVEVVR